jgi:hypothetical protein
MGRWLKKISETGAVPTDNTDKGGSVSLVSTLPPHIQKTQNPDALLMDIAAMLQANPDQLRALLSTDDIQDIAEGANSRVYMLDYFRLMRADGKLPIYTAPPPAMATEPPQSHLESAKAWKPAHKAMIDHVMSCTACRASQSRYCNEGADLRRVYLEACQSPASNVLHNLLNANA